MTDRDSATTGRETGTVRIYGTNATTVDRYRRGVTALSRRGALSRALLALAGCMAMIVGGCELGTAVPEGPSQAPISPSPTSPSGPSPTAPVDTGPTSTDVPRTPSSGPSALSTDPVSRLAFIDAADLPPEALQTLRLIDEDGPFPFDRDGITFQNREELLPERPGGYYREFTVVTPGLSHRGARRIVAGEGGERYYTADHYESFERIRLAGYDP